MWKVNLREWTRHRKGKDHAKAEHSHEYAITLLCQALEVSESGYYAWKNRKVSQHCQEDAKLAAEIQQMFLEHRQVYGMFLKTCT